MGREALRVALGTLIRMQDPFGLPPGSLVPPLLEAGVEETLEEGKRRGGKKRKKNEKEKTKEQEQSFSAQARTVDYRRPLEGVWDTAGDSKCLYFNQKS